MCDYDPKKELQSWEDAKKAMRCPRAKEAREALFLSVPQFCQLMEISEGDYYDMVAGSKQLSLSNKLFLVEAIRIARERGLIVDERD
jgi:hypothetical protein